MLINSSCLDPNKAATFKLHGWSRSNRDWCANETGDPPQAHGETHCMDIKTTHFWGDLLKIQKRDRTFVPDGFFYQTHTGIATWSSLYWMSSHWPISVQACSRCIPVKCSFSFCLSVDEAVYLKHLVHLKAANETLAEVKVEMNTPFHRAVRYDVLEMFCPVIQSPRFFHLTRELLSKCTWLLKRPWLWLKAWRTRWAGVALDTRQRK